MEEKPVEQSNMRKGWFQFHLSTAIVAMLFVGIFLFLNTSPTLESIWQLDKGDGFIFVLESNKDSVAAYGVELQKTDMESRSYGWPFKVWASDVLFSSDDPDSVVFRGHGLNYWLTVVNFLIIVATPTLVTIVLDKPLQMLFNKRKSK